MRTGFLLLLLVPILSPGLARAGVPDPSKGSIPTRIALQGTSDEARTIPDDCADLSPPGTRCGDFTVTIRDFAGVPVIGAQVDVRFGGCSDISVACDQLPLITGQWYMPADTAVRGYTDQNGRFTFRIRGAANAVVVPGTVTSPGTNLGVACARVYADGILMGNVRVQAYDYNGFGSPARAVSCVDAWTLQQEVVKVALGAQARERGDLNGSGSVNGADLAVMVSLVLDQLLGTGSRNTLVGPCPPVSVEARPASRGIAIEDIHPNPMTRSTTIRYAMPLRAPVTLAIYDLSGRRLSTLVDGDRPAGVHWATWDGRREGGALAPLGVYFARLRSAGIEDSRSIILVK